MTERTNDDRAAPPLTEPSDGPAPAPEAASAGPLAAAGMDPPTAAAHAQKGDAVVVPGDAGGAAPPEAGAEEHGERGGKKGKKKGKKDGVGTSRGIETMFRTSYRTHLDLSSLADTKANIMISINGIIISITIASISPKIDANPWLLVPTAVLLLTTMGSMVFAILAARPRISSNVVDLDDVRSNRANILFFGNFVNMREEDYLQGMKELMGNTDQLYSNMIRDIYSLGGVLSRKYALVRVAYTIFMWGLSVSVLLYVGVLTWVYTWAGTGFSVGP